MGYWMGLCIFDYSTFTQTLIPALQVGETHPLVQRTIELLNVSNLHFSFGESYSLLKFQGLEKVVAACDPNMLSCSLGNDFYVYKGEIVEKDLIAKGSKYWFHEDFVELFQWIVSRHAITHFYVFGKEPYDLDSFFCQDNASTIELDREPIDPNRARVPEQIRFPLIPPILLDSLNGWRENYGYWQFDGGICGWLNPEETELLLFSIKDLPVRECAPYPPDSPIFTRLYEECYENRDEYERHWKKLNIFRNIVQMAVDLKHGLIWGRDLGLFYSDIIFHKDDVKPIDLNKILEM
jgi:hypothetical protein